MSAERRVYQGLAQGIGGNAVWIFLLELYASHTECRRIDVSSLCRTAPIPAATALRKLQRLHAAGLIEREPDVMDRRRVFVSLPPQAIAKVEACLLEIAKIHGIEL
ncbi:MarR family transcriptional regulator [uncultured Sphingomonas sp.]|uniref:MarR family transcriptional regulator n=1 Tax=uncultured Sphingomonas sp. TaxID=158754 RepID=UPI002617923D|nr:MarR family transcriptional regulator [uncultured Sphingomonas sp.]